MKLVQLAGGSRARFRLAILGENLGSTPAGTEVLLDTQDPGKAVENQRVAFVSEKEVDVFGEAPIGTVITTVKVTVGGKTASSRDRTISFKAAQPGLKEFGMKFEHQKSNEFPNLHSLLVTKQSGDPGIGFDVNPNRMRVEVEPAGATDLSVVQSNEAQLDVHFVAAPDYEPKNVVITIYDGSDLDRRQAKAVAKVAVPAKDPNAPTITDVESVFLDRSRGNGRIRIYGKGFGQLEPPGFPVDDYLCNCLERPKLTGNRACGLLGEHQGAPGGNLKSDVSAERNSFCELYKSVWSKLQNSLRRQITVGVNSRNEAIRVEKAEIINVNDGMIDVYYEFTRYPGYAWPFRLSGVDLTVTKKVKKAEQIVKAEGFSGEVDVAAAETFTLAQVIGPKPDPNLTYQYTVLNQDAARSLLGDGVAEHFYVLQLSVVNHGAKKVSIPLAAIEAEVEWLHGTNPKVVGGVQDVYLEGPTTLAPIPLAAVSAYYGMYQKSAGRRTRVFNILEGVTTFVTALIPFAGPALKDAEVVFSGGAIPGLRQGWVDLAAQQLQNLTSLSWETAETVAAKGGSVEKYIYIQRKPQLKDDPETITDPPRRTGKVISNIMALEVTGFEVPDAPAKQATPADKKPAAQTTPKPAADTAPGTDAPPAPAS